jgi:hypothetical protein
MTDPHDPPPDLGAPATRALFAAGYRRLSRLAGVSEAELARLHGAGPKVLAHLRNVLREAGRSPG